MIKSLITALVSIFLIMIIIAGVSKDIWWDVIEITAAYAAVLVVFCGDKYTDSINMSSRCHLA